MSVNCSRSIPCHKWDCNYCFSVRVYWLREQFLSFARQSANQQYHFYTFKGFDSASSASDYLTYLKYQIKRAKPRYNAKSEYIFAIAKHNHSSWHIHLILNNPLLLPVHAHIEPVRDLKAAVLYLVKNLVMSQRQDYGSVRRYGGSSLLNKQSAKKAFKTRLRLFKLATRKVLAAVVVNAIIGMTSSVKVLRRVTCIRCVKSSCKPIPRNSATPVERPPPKRFAISG